MKAKLEALHLRGVRQFAELNVRFNHGFNFIAGPNGCGKTSILAGITHCLTTEGFENSRFRTDAELWIDATVDTNRYRVGVGAGFMGESDYRKTSVKRWVGPPVEGDRESVPVYQANDVLGPFAPFVIGAQRRIKYRQLQGVQREELGKSRVDQYISNSTRALYGEWQSDVKQWFINRYFMIDKEWAHEERLNWTHLLTQLPHIAPFDSDFKYVRTGRDLEPVFSIYGKECYLEEVSSGFQAVLLIIANIMEWIEGARSEGNRTVLNASGTVLIDELDIHLHPEWQFTIRDGLERIFPNLQFIVTTHSPHLLASAKANEVIVVPGRASDEQLIDLSPVDRSFSGWSTDQILYEVMGVRSLENKQYEKIVAEALLCIDREDSNALELAIEKLRTICHPNDSMLVVLTARLATLRVLSND